MRKGLAYSISAVAAYAVLATSSPYMSYTVSEAYAGERTKKVLNFAKKSADRLKELTQRSEKNHKLAKDIAGKVLETGGIPGAGRAIEIIDKHSFCPDGSIKKQRDSCKK